MNISLILQMIEIHFSGSKRSCLKTIKINYDFLDCIFIKTQIFQKFTDIFGCHVCNACMKIIRKTQNTFPESVVNYQKRKIFEKKKSHLIALY